MWYLEKYNLLTACQSGFRKHRSTNDNIIHLESQIHEAFANKQKLLAVFFDIEKAYDITWRHRIIRIIQDWNIIGNISAFIQNFLTNRSFKVRINGVLSNKKILQNGIPQGSVLSTTLFLIAINDIMISISLPVQANLYADDFVIYSKGTNIKTLESLIQQTINNIDTWTNSSGFKLSFEKTKCVLFSRTNQTTQPLLTLKGEALSFSNNIKFLGVFFDHKLNWKDHLNHLVLNCTKSINLLKILSHHSWGADMTHLLTIYRSIIRSRIDYGLIAYGSSRKSYLKAAKSIENKALRIITGAFPTTPIESLHCLVGEISLSDRIMSASLSYATKIAASTNNFNYDHTFSDRFKLIYDRNPNIIPPFYERVNRYLTQINFPLPTTILPSINSNTTPWTLSPIKLNTELSRYNKRDTHPQIILNAFHQLSTTFMNSEFIYTDASMNSEDHSVGTATVTPNATLKFRLPKGSSVYTGEMFAIYQALTNIMNSYREGNYIICSDSLSSLQSIRQLYCHNPLTQLIQQMTYQLHLLNVSVTFVYVPSHIGILGNETADIAARDAATSPTVETCDIHTQSDLICVLKKSINERWQQKWNNSNAKLKKVKPTINNILPLPPTRRDQVKISRLRLGHTRLTHGHLLAKENQPLCEFCHENITVEHVLIDCPQYVEERRNLKIGHISEALGENIHNLNDTIRFLKAINMYHKI